MNKMFAIGIPTLNRADLLTPSLEKYYKDFPNTFFVIVDNGCQTIPVNQNTILFRQDKNLGVPASWNILARYVFYRLDIPNIYILNDDVYWGRHEKDVIKFIEENSRYDFVASTKEWCNFLLTQDTFEMVGIFDEQIMCYFEDNDFAYRMKLLDLNTTSSEFLYPDLFRKSKSQEKDQALKQWFQISREYYKRKWGGYPGEEVFRTPFGLNEYSLTE